MSAKRKSFLTWLLLTVLAAALVMAGATGVAFAGVMSPYSPSESFSLSLAYEDGDLVISTEGGEGEYLYQYWIKEKVRTDLNSGNLNSNQYIWQLLRGYESGSQYIIQDIGSTEKYRDERGAYNVIVRIKSGDAVIDEIYGSFTSDEIGETIISGISVDGRTSEDNYFVVSRQPFNIAVTATNAAAYKIMAGEDVILTSGNGVFQNVQVSSLAEGLNVLTVRAEGPDGFDESQLRLFVVDNNYNRQKPIIVSLSGESDWDNGGLTTFVMKVKAADGSAIESADGLIFRLKSGTKEGDFLGTAYNEEDGTLDVSFEIDFGGKHGIYYTVATVSRTPASEDDKIIQYYGGYAREAYLTQTGNYEASAGENITITAEGDIPSKSGDIQYAFYREDASGWVLIRDYASSGTIQWKPTRSGKYVIQARIKDTEAGSYEKAVSKEYHVTGSRLEGELEIGVYDLKTGSEASTLFAGTPYKIEARYTEADGEEVSDRLLYMFTLYSANLNTIYLNKYGPNPYYVFVPGRPDSFVITARAISMDSFGYKDISQSVQLDSVLITGETINEMLKFNRPESLLFATGVLPKSIVEDSQCDDNSALEATIKNDSSMPSGRYDLAIDLGGIYKANAIEVIIVRYKVVEGNGSYWWRVFLNNYTSSGQQVKSFTDAQMSDYNLLYIYKSDIPQAIKDNDEYLSRITFGKTDFHDGSYPIKIRIDSVVVYETIDYAQSLLFDESSSLVVVNSEMPYSIVDDNGISALEGKVKWNNLAPSGRKDLKVYLGGIYKVEEIESIEIRVRVPEIAAGGFWCRMYFNNFTAAGEHIASINGSKTSATYSTVTVTQSQLLQRLSAGDYLDSISFGDEQSRGSSDRWVMLRIDYIKINLIN